MKEKIPKVAAFALVGAAALFCMQARATPITWTFMENGMNQNLGPSSTFMENGYTLTAYGFTDDGTQSDLYAKHTSGNPAETGLGMVADIGGDHEIDSGHFVQLATAIDPSGSITALALGSIQVGESAAIYGSNTLGDLGTQLTTLSMNGSADVANWASLYQYIGLTDMGLSPLGNVLIGSVTAPGPASNVPDGGATVALLGLGLLGLALISRRQRWRFKALGV